MIKNLWCLLFHRHHVHQKSAAGDWKFMHCDKCQITWPEPRL